MKHYITYLLAFTFLAVACNKIKVEKPALDIKLPTLNYKLGDTVTFTLNGDADYIYFFSGELGKEYTKRNQYKTDKSGKPELEFDSKVQYGTITINNLSVLVSTDFDGIYDTTHVKDATWTDITDLAQLGTGSSATKSGVVDLSTYAVDGKPMYIAYRYLAFDADNLKQRTWTVGNFGFTTVHDDGEEVNNAVSFESSLFQQVDFLNKASNWTINSTNITHRGEAAGTPADDDWVISKGFNLMKAQGDAAGVETIKNLTTGFTPSTFTHLYTKPGTYKATVVAKNATADAEKDLITDFNIVITP